VGEIVADARISVRRYPGRHWSIDDIPWHAVDRSAIAGCEEFFYLVAAASFMEWTTDLYTRNLIDFFVGDEEVTQWLERHWLTEELQHGRSLRRYVETAWPEFDWPSVYRSFVDEFRAYCQPEGLEAARALEMASRCVVETGTAVYYTTLSRASPEPVLTLLARRIADDEIRHYKHFYRFFRKYREMEKLGPGAVLPALWRRLRMTGGEDSFVVLKHVYQATRPDARFDKHTYRALRRRGRHLVRRHFPYEMSVKMLLRPLDLGPGAQRLTVPLAEALARRLVP
jgi:hypothetical protein